MSGEAQSEYYQAVAKEFLRRRGAPFFLSPRDLALIAVWEKKSVPLDIILEGIGRAFDDRRRRTRGTKGLGLGFCEVQVDRAFAQYRDRKAGGRRAAPQQPDKRAGVRREIEKYLGSVPGVNDVPAALLAEAMRILSVPVLDEEALERIDDEVDASLLGGTPQEEKDRARRQALRDFPGRSPDEVDAAVRTRLVKAARDKFRIPYVSLFYY